MIARTAVILVSALALTLSACGGGKRGGGSDSGATVSAGVRELPMPVVPDSLVTPEERAGYAVCHFWDAMDFADTAMATDTALVEQSFSNFISLLPYAEPVNRRLAVTALLDRAAGGGAGAYNLVLSTAEHYLWDAESPFCSEDLYLPFVDYMLERNPDDPVAGDRHDLIMKNRPGSTAPDFTVGGRNGAQIRLHDHAAGVATLLMFYEPDCDRCHDAFASMTADPAIADAIAAGRLRVLAVYVGDDTAAWAEHAATLPAAWQVAIDAASAIDDRDLYTIRATPAFYLVSPANTILLKDAPLPQIQAALSTP